MRTDPFDKNKVDGNVLDRLAAVEAELASLRRRPVKANNLVELAPEVGEMQFRAVDSAGQLRAILSAINLIDELGVNAYFALIDQYKKNQIWGDADTGQLTTAAGNLSLGAGGIEYIQSAIFASLTAKTGINQDKWVYLTGNLAFTKADGTNDARFGTHLFHVLSFAGTPLVTNGSFETGDFTGFTVTGSPVISTDAPKGLYSAQVIGTTDYITWTWSATVGLYYLVQLYAKTAAVGPILDGTGLDWVSDWIPAHASAVPTKWTKMAILVRATSTAPTLSFKGSGGNAWVDDIVVDLVDTFQSIGMTADRTLATGLTVFQSERQYGTLRRQLLAPLILYVRPHGSDSHYTGTSNIDSDAFGTIQHAVDVANGYDNGGNNVTINISDNSWATTNRQRTANVATLTLNATHDIKVGDGVIVSGVGGAGYNGGAFTVTAITATTFSYANVAANEGLTADTGGRASLNCYRENVTLPPFVGSGHIVIKGNNSVPRNVQLLAATAAPYFNCLSAGAIYELQGLTPDSSIAVVLRCANYGILEITGKIVFKTTTSVHVQAVTGQVLFLADYDIDGAALWHWQTSSGGYIQALAITITISNTPAFTSFARGDVNGMMLVNGNTFAGSGATGQRYNMNGCAVCFVNGAGAAYLPGNAAGATANGGQYY